MASPELEIEEGKSEEEDDGQFGNMENTGGFSQGQNEELQEEDKIQQYLTENKSSEQNQEQMQRPESQFSRQSKGNENFIGTNAFQEQQPSKQQTPSQNQTFVTQDEKSMYTANDLLFAGGKFAKLIKISDPYDSRLNINEILKRTQVQTFNHVIMLAGVDGEQHAKVLQGVVRAAQYTDAVIVDSGLRNGIESMCYSKKIKLIGVCPESCIVYPTKDSTGERLSELTPGHSHFMVLQKGNMWGSEAEFKKQLIQKITKGAFGCPPCKVIMILIMDRFQVEEEISIAVQNDWPILVLARSSFTKQITEALQGNSQPPENWGELLNNGRWYVLDQDCTAEELAVTCHLHLTVRISN